MDIKEFILERISLNRGKKKSGSSNVRLAQSTAHVQETSQLMQQNILMTVERGEKLQGRAGQCNKPTRIKEM